MSDRIRHIGRRDFLRLAGVCGPALLTSCSPKINRTLNYINSQITNQKPPNSQELEEQRIGDPGDCDFAGRYSPSRNKVDFFDKRSGGEDMQHMGCISFNGVGAKNARPACQGLTPNFEAKLGDTIFKIDFAGKDNIPYAFEANGETCKLEQGK
jgi:hypothetical protein